MKTNYDYEWNFLHFTPFEVACKCGCGLMPTEEAMLALQRLRNEYGSPMTINSGARCAAHNAKVGGARNSYHIKGEAFDVRINQKDAPRLLAYASWNTDFNGIGISLKSYWGFIHIDTRPENQARVFTY